MHRRLFFLLAGHIALDVLVLALTFLIAPPAYIAAMCLVSAQLSLAAVWFGLAPSGRRRRLGVAVLAVCGSTLLMTIALGNYLASHGAGVDRFDGWPRFAVFNSAKFVVLAATVGGLRLWRVELQQASDLGPSPPGSGFRFSILHMMLLTLVVALFLAVGQHIRGLFGTSLQALPGPLAYLLLQCINVVVGVLQAAAVALLALWASLAADRPHWRVAAALVLSVGVGLAAPFVFAGPLGHYVVGILYAAAHVAIVVASLLVVRSCGYRLAVSRVAQPVHAADSEQPAAG